MATTAYKPASIPVFPPHADPEGACVLKTLFCAQPWRAERSWPEGFAGGIAHRLDVHTSGAILVADTPEELAGLRQLFRARALTKTYRLLTSRDVPWAENGCQRPIAHDRRKRNRMIVQRGPRTPHRGKWTDAETQFRRLHGRLFEARMTTGVMHQIRVHAAFLGIPLLGDRVYGTGGGDHHHLHHVGLQGPDGLQTDPVPMPEWARDHATLS